MHPAYSLNMITYSALVDIDLAGVKSSCKIVDTQGPTSRTKEKMKNKRMIYVSR